jgi:hypothetical protein
MTAPGRRRPRDGWLLVALTVWSGHYFFRYGGTAYEWPAVDIAPLVARQLDPTFLENDFFTNASAEANPRHVFASLVVGVARLFGDDWYAALYLLRVTAAFLLPVLWYLVLSGYVRAWFVGDGQNDEDTPYNERDPRRDAYPLAASVAGSLVILAGLAEIIRPSVAALFSIAWWSPFQPQATSATYSLVCTLAGNALLLRRTRASAICGVAAWTAASLLHPAVSLFAIVFHGIATYGRWRGASAAAAVVAGWLVPCAVLAFVCQPSVTISAEGFVRTYVRLRHPHHYWPPAFGSLTEWPWQTSFLLLAGVMLAALPWAAWRRNRRLARLTLLFVAAYAGCVALQYLVAVIWPVKLIAMLGPVRFSAFGFYAWLLLAAIVAADITQTIVARRTAAMAIPCRSNRAAWQVLMLPRGSTLILILLAAVYVGVSKRDDPFEQQRQANAAFYESIRPTRDGSVFAAADELSVDIALVGRRAVFTGFGLPFREDFFAEYAHRQALLFGTLERRAELSRGGRRGVDAKLVFFRRLGPRDFVRIADERQLDYVIIEAQHAEQFASIVPLYANADWRVYAVDTLREIVRQR